MYSFKDLLKLNPTLTGKEIYELHLKEKQDEENRINILYEKHIKFIDNLNKNGAYFKGKFGKQTFFYNITNIVFNKTSNYTTCNLESITIHNNFTDKLNIDWRNKERMKDFTTLAVECYERIPKEEWDYVANYLEPNNLINKLYNYKK